VPARRLLHLATLALLVTGVAPAETQPASPTLVEVLTRVNDANRRLQSWSASFTERHNYVHFDTSETRSGEMFYRRGHGLRIDLVEPDEEMVLVDSERALTWRPKTNQVNVFKFDGRKRGAADTPIPLPIGGDGWDPQSGHTVRLLDAAGPELLLELVPNDQTSYQKKLVWIDPESWLPSALQLVETTDDEIHYSFTSIQIDVPIDEDRFRFEPPDDAEVVTHDQLPQL